MGRSRFAAQRWDSLACLSPAHSFMQTPHIEALASRGTVFERCYTTAPLCVPMRASMMSGMYASTTGIMANNHWLSPATPVWSSAAADAGFATAAIGKMHFAPWDDLGGFAERIIAEDKRHVYLPDDHAVFLAEHGHERAHPTANPGYFENLGASVTPLPKRFHIGTPLAAARGPLLQSERKGCAAQMASSAIRRRAGSRSTARPAPHRLRPGYPSLARMIRNNTAKHFS